MGRYADRVPISKDELRRRLNADRVWSIYALADLDPGLFEQCEWNIAGDGLSLVFTGIPIRPIFILGNAAEARALLAALPCDSGYLNLRAERLDAAAGIFHYTHRNHMHRMALGEFKPRCADVETLGPADAAEIQRLYATGSGAGVAFAAFQLETGFFRGVIRNGELAAVAGVHIVSRAEGVAGVGNIFTRTDYRGQGLAQVVTSAVTAALLDVGIETIALHVEASNAPAISAYRRLGFRVAFDYWEGPAVRAGLD